MKQYNKYKESGISWIGDIPEHWEVKRLKSQLSLVKDKGTNSIKIGLENIESFTGRFLPSNSLFDGEGIQVHIGDIVYGKLRPYLCKVWLASFECCAIGDFYVFRCGSNCDKRFMSYLFLSAPFTGICNASTYGAKMPRVSSNFMLSLPIPLPPHYEQEAIVAHLEEKVAQIDNLVAKQEAQIAYLRELKQAIIAKAVTQGLNPQAPLRPSGVPWIDDIPEHWEPKIGKRIYLANDGGVWGNDPDGENDTIVLRSTEQAEDGTLKIINPARRKLSAEEQANNKLVAGDLIITKSSGSSSHIGKTSLIDKETEKLGCCYSNFIQRIRIKGSSKYYWYVFNSPFVRDQFQNLATTTTGLGNLSQSLINHLLLPLPPLEEQAAIVAYLDTKTEQINRLINKTEESIIRMKELKQRLIADAVTGRINFQAS